MIVILKNMFYDQKEFSENSVTKIYGKRPSI